jgi:hypothetical protein
VEKIPGGFKVIDANRQSLAYVYSRETKDAAKIAGVLTEDEARRMATLPSCLNYSARRCLTMPSTISQTNGTRQKTPRRNRTN